VLAMAFYFANTSIEYENKGKTTEVSVRFRKSGQMKSFFENWKAPQVGAPQVGMSV